MTQTIGQEAFDALRTYETMAFEIDANQLTQGQRFDIDYAYRRAALIADLAVTEAIDRQTEQLRRIADWLDGAGCDHES